MPDSSTDVEQRAIELPWGTCRYGLKRSKRRSIGFLITDEGLQISAPHRVAMVEIERIIASKSSWIEKSLSRWQSRKRNSTNLENLLAEGQAIPVRGQAFQVEHTSTARPMLNPWTQHITLPGSVRHSPPAQLKSLEKVLKTHAKEVFTHMAQTLAQRMELPPFQIRLSSPNARWGSCNSRGEVRLNWRLVHYPLPMIEYVIAHELAHLKEMNHSPRFWAIVEQLMPNYREPHKALSQLSPSEVPRL